MQGLVQSNRFRLVAAADTRPEALAKLADDYPGIRTFTDHRAMFAACPTDVVCISTYPPSHESVTIDALSLPLKGILVEKPLGHTVESGRRILSAIKTRSLPMAVPHNLLAKKTPVEILGLVHNAAIGELKLVEIQCSGWDIMNAGIHWLDFFVALTGNEPPASVLALCDTRTRTFRDGMQVETVAVTYGQMRNGVRVVMQTGDDVAVNEPGKDTLFRLIGSQGQIEFWGWENGYTILNADHPSKTLVTPEEFAVTGHQRHLERLADTIAAGEPDYAIPEGSLLALELCEAAYLSSRCHCQVTFPLDQFVAPASSAWDPGKPYGGTGGGRDGRIL
jgi:predicted dehydrogenase